MGSTQYSKRIPDRTYVRRPRSRPKTFKTEAGATAWAELKGLKNYELVNLRNPEAKDKKIRVVSQ